MKLDFSEESGKFFVTVPRGENATIRSLMQDHGFDFSTTASQPNQAVLFTAEPYAAVAFYEYATDRAQSALISLHKDIETSFATQSSGHIDVPYGQELSPFQIAGVEYALRRKHSLIGDVPGLGKTMQAIAYANETRARRVLVICPANIRLQWVAKIREWTTMPWPYHVYPVLHSRHGIHPTAEWTVISYDLARSPAVMAALLKGWYDVLILDEAHYLKSVDAKRTRSVFYGDKDRASLSSRCGNILALTGTPLPNRPREAYVLSRNMCPDAIDFMSEEKFRNRFNPSQVGEQAETGMIYVDERTGRHGELQSRLRANFMIRRQKHGPEGVQQQLKLPIFDIVRIEPDGPIKQALAAERLLDLDPDSLPGPADPIFGAIATVRRLMGVALAPHAADYIEMCLIGGEDKIVAFGHHIEALDIVQHKLARFGVVRIDGRTGAAKKQLLVDQFRKDPDIRICLGNILSMGTGTDGLQDVADHAIIFEPDWTPGVNQQAIDRLDRMGQKGQVQADFLVAPESFSEKVLATALRKVHVTDKALDRRF